MRTVDLKKKFRRAAEAQAMGKLAPHIILRRLQAFEGALGFVVVAGDRDQDVGGTRVLGHLNRRDAGQANARISQLTLEEGFDLLPKSLAQAFPVNFLGTVFHRGKRVRIAEKQVSGLRSQVLGVRSQGGVDPSAETNS
jgi:hypothetical protein